MKQTINFSTFCDEFKRMDRNENFSYAGKQSLFEYLEDLEADMGVEVELDILALCSEYTEATLEELHESFDFDDDNDLLEYLNNSTTLLKVGPETYIYGEF